MTTQSLPSGGHSSLLLRETPGAGWHGFAAREVQEDPTSHGEPHTNLVVWKWTVPAAITKRLNTIKVPLLCDLPRDMVLDGTYLEVETGMRDVSSRLSFLLSAPPASLLPLVRFHATVCKAAERQER